MSNEESKAHHSKRRHRTEVKSKRQAKIAKSAGLKVESPHVYAKRRALNCGNPHCFTCMNPRKANGDRTIQEQRFYQTEIDPNN
jgi:hypothetical protein